MLNFIIVFIGGGLGSLSRYGVSLLFTTHKSVATLLVNIIGCFLIATLDGLFKKYHIHFILTSEQTRLLFIMGFLGGFTTYSSFLLDFFNHADTSIGIAILYLGASIFLGLVAFMIGVNLLKLF
ncbi:MAG: CrcB family protein [Alphaproteobacteria bacterium]|jgi:CrcB protein|nr:CrcB family protein [Alphaproteobacteria bacterium]